MCQLFVGLDAGCDLVVFFVPISIAIPRKTTPITKPLSTQFQTYQKRI